MKRIGKIGKRNVESNRLLKNQFESAGITRCEVTGRDWMLSFAHKDKRRNYLSCPEEMSKIENVLLLTIPVHNLIEHNRDLTLKIFDCLRPIGKEDGRNNARRLIVNYLESIGKIYLVDTIL